MAIQWGDERGVTHEGRVLAYPVYHAQACNSDYERVYATVILDGGVTNDIPVGTVSYASSWGGYATPDATDEARAEMDAWQAHRERVIREADEATAAVNRFYRLEVGALVRFAAGRKVKKGTVARLTWFGERYDALRYGVDVAGGRVFGDAGNCVRDHTPDEAEALDRTWDRWIAAHAAAQDLYEHEANIRGDFDPKLADHYWYDYGRAVARWKGDDWAEHRAEHKAAIVARLKAARKVVHVPNRSEAGKPEPELAGV